MKLTEADIREITLSVIQELGDNADHVLVNKAVVDRVEKLEQLDEIALSHEQHYERIILVAFGLNRTNVTAKISGLLSTAGCSIRNISQKMMDNFFTLAMLIDNSNSTKDINQIQTEMDKIAEGLKIKIYLTVKFLKS